MVSLLQLSIIVSSDLTFGPPNPKPACDCRTLQVTAGLRSQGTKVVLRWAPAHEGIQGNELAHKYARESTSKDSVVEGVPILRLKSQALRTGRTRILKEERRDSAAFPFQMPATG